MHDIEPYFKWRDRYVASEDERSPFYGREYNEFQFHQKVYNYYIHPQWDEFGSATLYSKILYCDYDEGYAILEFIGEWNDCLSNDVMILKQNVINRLIDQSINKFILLCDNLMNFHGDDDCYYEERFGDIGDEGGGSCMLDTREHVEEEIRATFIDQYVNLGESFNNIHWRSITPITLFDTVCDRIGSMIRMLPN
ncbi:MAG: hypothetical protein KJP00_02350 [Bacteroidia bacterium]|nr:hypothetical protein [Bacteroidia bacterium]